VNNHWKARKSIKHTLLFLSSIQLSPTAHSITSYIIFLNNLLSSPWCSAEVHSKGSFCGSIQWKINILFIIFLAIVAQGYYYLKRPGTASQCLRELLLFQLVCDKIIFSARSIYHESFIISNEMPRANFQYLAAADIRDRELRTQASLSSIRSCRSRLISSGTFISISETTFRVHKGTINSETRGLQGDPIKCSNFKS
jgi:hypothetical protein